MSGHRDPFIWVKNYFYGLLTLHFAAVFQRWGKLQSLCSGKSRFFKHTRWCRLQYSGHIDAAVLIDKNPQFYLARDPHFIGLFWINELNFVDLRSTHIEFFRSKISIKRKFELHAFLDRLPAR